MTEKPPAAPAETGADTTAEAAVPPSAEAAPDTTPEAGTPGKGPEQKPGEIGGPSGPEPTRYGDWEFKGRCSDF